MAYGTINADLMTTSDGVSSSGLYGFKNRIINGAMMIDQRNAGASVSIATTSDVYTIDRWAAAGQSADGVFTVQQDTTVPAGFKNSMKITVTTADSSIGASQYYLMQHSIEGLNVPDLNWGTANAQTVTLSFWVRSSVTGTFGGSLRGSFTTSTRSYPFSYTISSANTWEQKSITIAGDTSGTWATDNTTGIRITWSIGDGSSRLGTSGAWATANYSGATGQNNLIATNGATFYITGVQLEKGSTATSFDYRPYMNELQLCQRYFQKISGGINGGPYQQFGMLAYEGTTTAWGTIPLRVTMRAQPTSAYSGPFTISYGTQGTFINDTNQTGGDIAVMGFSTGSGGAAGYSAYVRATNSNSAFMSFSAEL